MGGRGRCSMVPVYLFSGQKVKAKGQQFETDDLVEKAEKIIQNEGVLCLEVVTNTEGEILPHHLEQIRQVGKGIREARKN